MLARAAVIRTTGELTVEVALGIASRKEVKINGVPERRITRLVGNLAAVLFSPDDLQLLKGPPSGRRRFLDVELSQLSQNYLHYLITYNKILAQRNTLLKQLAPEQALLDILSEQLVAAGAQIVVRRSEAVDALAPLAGGYHNMLSEAKESLRLEYQTQAQVDTLPLSAETVSEDLRTQLQRRRSEEFRRQVTLVGPHRDDLGFWLDHNDTRLYASQGQQRTAVLALKLAELQYMTEILAESPLLLLDDVASELDPHRRNHLLHAVNQGVQTIITCTDLDDLMIQQWPAEYRIFRVRHGAISVEDRRVS